MIVVGAGRDEKKVKVDSVFLLYLEVLAKTSPHHFIFLNKVASSVDDLINFLICFRSKYV